MLLAKLANHFVGSSLVKFPACCQKPAPPDVNCTVGEFGAIVCPSSANATTSPVPPAPGPVIPENVPPSAVLIPETTMTPTALTKASPLASTPYVFVNVRPVPESIKVVPAIGAPVTLGSNA